MSILIKKQTKHVVRYLSRVLVCGLPVVSMLFVGCASKPQIATTQRIAPAPNSYVVQPGDTLSGIASRYGLNYLTVAQNNGVASPYTIYVGQSLRLTGTAVAATNIRPQNFATQPQAPSIPPIQSQSIPLPNAQPVSVAPTNTIAPPVQTTPNQQVNTPVNNGLHWVKPSTGTIIAKYDLSRNIKGIRYSGQVGDPVLAAADGQVVYADNGLKEFGNLVLIKHSNGYISAYAHNSTLLVQSGARVKAGQKIAQMGSSGTDRVMLEFQLRSAGKAIDPASVIPTN